MKAAQTFSSDDAKAAYQAGYDVAISGEDRNALADAYAAGWDPAAEAPAGEKWYSNAFWRYTSIWEDGWCDAREHLGIQYSHL